MPITVSTDLPFGNACDLAVTQQGDVACVEFAAAPHGGPETLWFCLRVAQDRAEDAPRTLRLILKHVGNMLGGDNPVKMRPVAKVGAGDWERLAAPEVQRLPDGRRRAVWEVPWRGDPIDVAFCYPYGREQLEQLLEDCGDCWKADTIGVSQGARPLVRLSNDYGAEGGRRPGIYVIARQHSAETPGSWVMDGLLRAFGEMGPEAPLVWAIPFANIDGVEQGDYGKDNFPYDLNRAWGQPPMRHETLAFQRDVARWRLRCQPLLGLDLHAPGACEDAGVYAFVLKPTRFPEQHDRTRPWVHAVEAALHPEYAAGQFQRTANYASRWETPNFTAYCASQFNLCAFSLEIAYALSGERVLVREDYREIGRRIAHVLQEQARQTVCGG